MRVITWVRKKITHTGENCSVFCKIDTGQCIRVALGDGAMQNKFSAKCVGEGDPELYIVHYIISMDAADSTGWR